MRRDQAATQAGAILNKCDEIIAQAFLGLASVSATDWQSLNK